MLLSVLEGVVAGGFTAFRRLELERVLPAAGHRANTLSCSFGKIVEFQIETWAA
jgi:hypothetical protein